MVCCALGVILIISCSSSSFVYIRLRREEGRYIVLYFCCVFCVTLFELQYCYKNHLKDAYCIKAFFGGIRWGSLHVKVFEILYCYCQSLHRLLHVNLVWSIVHSRLHMYIQSKFCLFLTDDCLPHRELAPDIWYHPNHIPKPINCSKRNSNSHPPLKKTICKHGRQKSVSRIKKQSLLKRVIHIVH